MSVLIAIAWLAVASADPAQVDVYATLDPPVVPFHRQAEYTITAETPADVEVKMPDMLDKFSGLSVADVRRNTEVLKGNRRRIIETYVLDPIFIGCYKIYPADVTWGDSGGVSVPSPALRVRDLTDDEKLAAEQFAASAGPAPVPSAWAQHWKLWAAMATALLAALCVAAYIYRRRVRRAEQAPPPPPWEVAYQRLRELDQRQLPKAGKYEPYYVDLTSIVRYYIEDQFLLHAPEQTTQEFLAASSGSHLFLDEQQQLLSGFLRHCDRVKFAQYEPSEPEMDRCFAFVLQFVDETKPAPVEEARPPEVAQPPSAGDQETAA